LEHVKPFVAAFGYGTGFYAIFRRRLGVGGWEARRRKKKKE